MLFVEFRFFWFFLLVFSVYWSLRNNTARKIWLLACSYCFYAAWNWKFLFLLIGSSLLDYSVGVMLSRTGDARRRRFWLIVSLTANLGTIVIFKYCNFFIASAGTLLEWLGLPANIHTLNIVIPVGVSFYTFHSMSYTIDVYRRKMEPVLNLVDVACFIGFFPQMVAGPIVRGFSFLPQLKTIRRFDNVDVRGALVMFMIGFVKKACIADAFAPVSDKFFAAPWDYSGVSAWIGVLAYAVQIYCDFSGYTDMAIASARLLGYELTINFNFPYAARDIAGFWHRWHISLSSWLRDYLYIPLGGNRGGRWLMYRNIMITMLLGGLWHGGAWTFVIWGGLHGLALVVHREWQRRTGNVQAIENAMNWLGMPLTFCWVCLCWVFFRATDLHAVGAALRGMTSFVHTHAPEHFSPANLVMFLALGIIHWLNSRKTFAGWWRRGPDATFAMGYGCAAAVVLLFIPAKYTPFIYFQF